jgi:hypothetical protein
VGYIIDQIARGTQTRYHEVPIHIEFHECLVWGFNQHVEDKNLVRINVKNIISHSYSSASIIGENPRRKEKSASGQATVNKDSPWQRSHL